MGSSPSPENSEAGNASNVKVAPRVSRRRAITTILGAGVAVVAAAGTAVALSAGRKENQAAIETLTSSKNPYEFSYQGINHQWDIHYSTFGIPPNDSSRGVGTIYDTNKNNGQTLNYIQPYTLIYPEIQLGPGVEVFVGAQLADTQTGKGYMMTLVSGSNPGVLHSRFEIIDNLN